MRILGARRFQVCLESMGLKESSRELPVFAPWSSTYRHQVGTTWGRAETFRRWESFEERRDCESSCSSGVHIYSSGVHIYSSGVRPRPSSTQLNLAGAVGTAASEEGVVFEGVLFEICFFFVWYKSRSCHRVAIDNLLLKPSRNVTRETSLEI